MNARPTPTLGRIIHVCAGPGYTGDGDWRAAIVVSEPDAVGQFYAYVYTAPSQPELPNGAYWALSPHLEWTGISAPYLGQWRWPPHT